MSEYICLYNLDTLCKLEMHHTTNKRLMRSNLAQWSVNKEF